MTIPTLTSGSGFTVPAVGFGTYPLRGSGGAKAVGQALEAGYRLVDSAFNYENEGTVASAIRDSGLRDEVIMTSKLPGRHHQYDKALAAVQESVYRTGLDAIDLYLIHWPNPKIGLYVEAWSAMVEAQRQGLLKQIGVSNFLPEHLERLEAETGVLPVVNQIELHPYFPQTEAIAYHREHGILVEAWSPLGRGSDLLTNPVITTVAAAHGVSPAQVVLRWHVQLGVIPLPKAASPSRQKENLDLFGFELSVDEMAGITMLGKPDGRMSNQDPAVYEEL